MEQLKEIIEILNGIEEGSLAYNVFILLFIFSILAITIASFVWLCKKFPELNDCSNPVTNNQKEQGETECD